jgi:hypothetical protein
MSTSRHSSTLPTDSLSARVNCSKRSTPWIASILVGIVGDADEAEDVEFDHVIGRVSGLDESGLDHAEALRDGG